MKQQILLFLTFLIIYGCSSSSDENSTTNVLPTAPSNLKRILSIGNEVVLNWDDNSDNEAGFKLEVKINSGNFEILQNLNSNLIQYTVVGLQGNTSYTYRVCSFNQNGNSTSYSNEVTVTTDIDGNAYTNIKIGNQTWMKENYCVTRYRNGDLIPKMQAGQAVLTPNGYVMWSNLTNIQYGAYMDEYNSDIVFPKGFSYNWYAVNDSRGLAPSGWHIPTRNDWIILKEYLGGELIAGGKMKETSTEYWANPNTGSTNSSGFSARGYGFFKFNGTASGSSFEQQQFLSYFWSSTEFDITKAYSYQLFYNNEKLLEAYITEYKVQGGSIRCIKD